MKKTYNSYTLGNKKFNFIALPQSNYFKLTIMHTIGSNIERVYKQKTGRNVFGVAHLIEHLAFKSTKDYSTEQLLKIDKTKGSHNAGTTYDFIDYMFKTTMANIDLAINVVFNVAYNDLSKLTSKEFEIEKMVVANEIRRYMDDDQTMFMFNSSLVACGYEEGDNVLGLPSIIEAITLEDVKIIKNILLSNQNVAFNIVYDPCKASQEMIIDKILQEEKRFLQTLSPSIVSQEEYMQGLRFPKKGNVMMSNEAEQAMTMLAFELKENVVLSEIVGKYFEVFAEETSLDDLIRQKNGLTYGIEFIIDPLSYKPYQFFSCDVSIGDEQKLMDLFKQSIHETVIRFTPERHKAFMDALILKKTLMHINLESYESLFSIDKIDPTTLKPLESILAHDLDEAFLKMYQEYASYENMLRAMNHFQEDLDKGNYTRITNTI